MEFLFIRDSVMNVLLMRWRVSHVGYVRSEKADPAADTGKEREEEEFYISANHSTRFCSSDWTPGRATIDLELSIESSSGGFWSHCTRSKLKANGRIESCNFTWRQQHGNKEGIVKRNKRRVDKSSTILVLPTLTYFRLLWMFSNLISLTISYS